MNLYIVVEGKRTEVNVYPAWISLLVPQLNRIEDAWDVTENCYYLFSGGGIPHIFNHVMNSIRDINSIEKETGHTYDYLVVCLDTEESNRETIEKRISDDINKHNLCLTHAQLVIIEQRVCMETWFLGNRLIFKDNPQSQLYRDCIHYYDVCRNNPEEMGSNDEELNKAQFHIKYLKEMFRERHMMYSKTNTKEVEKESYLNQLVNRYKDTGHLVTFGKWLDFILSIMPNKDKD